MSPFFLSPGLSEIKHVFLSRLSFLHSVVETDTLVSCYYTDIYESLSIRTETDADKDNLKLTVNGNEHKLVRNVGGERNFYEHCSYD